ncbi:MAG: YraN family protein [Patescibacteria group bacterium]
MNRTKGAFGENIAKNYLESLGMKVLCLNWTCHWGELDIIAKEGIVLVFVEVKYRTSLKYGQPYEALTYKKRANLQRSINFYLTKQHVQMWRLDFISITKLQGNYKILYYPSFPL